jgi:hypothetical protein
MFNQICTSNDQHQIRIRIELNYVFEELCGPIESYDIIYLISQI